MKNIFLPIIFLFLSSVTIAQKNIDFNKNNFSKDQLSDFKVANKNFKSGDEMFIRGQNWYPQALDFYLNANNFNPNNAKLNYRIGKCYLISDKSKSIPYFEKAIILDSNVENDIAYLLAQAYHFNYEFEKAIKMYTRSKSDVPPAKHPIIERSIKECKTGIRMKEKPSRVFIDNIGSTVNSKYYDYSPIINADESMMIFCSRRDNTVGGEIDPDDNTYYEDIYVTYKENKEWQTPINPGKPLNSSGNDAPVGLSPDGQKLFVYKGINGGDIYECVLDGDKWSKPKDLGKNINTKYHESSASFAFDGRTIYYISNRPKGIGGHDIYYSKIDEKGNWGEAINLGATINTPQDELGVFMHPDGKTIYFSSKGHNTIGGFDIFKSVFENGKWSKPTNLGYPINTPGNDVCFSISANGIHGYYHSAKPGGFGGRDIYVITFLGFKKTLINNTEDNLLASIAQPVTETVIEHAIGQSAQLTLLKGKVLDEKTMEPLKATIEITDNQISEIVSSFESNSKTGRYLVSLPSGKNYGIAVKAEGYLFHSENFDITASKEFREIKKDILLKKVEVGSKIVLNNIFFDYNKYSLRKESTSELDRLVELLTDIPTLKIEISGHTDNRGSSTYNKTLSENRAKSVVNYLISKGIEKSRLTYIGYGFDQPIAENNTNKGRQMNRRTEFKVTSK